MARCFHPRRGVDGRPEVVARSLLCLTEVHADADAKRGARPRCRIERLLDLLGNGDRVGCALEGRAERVAGRREHVATEPFDLRAHDIVVHTQGRRHRLRIGGPHPGAAFHIGEQERHYP